MDREKKSTLPKKKVVISTRTTCSGSKKVGGSDISRKDIVQCEGTGRLIRRGKENYTLLNQKSISDLMTDLMLSEHEKKNIFDPMFMSLDDIRGKPDLWMTAFDNPIDFIEYCRKRLDHERELLEKSRQVEDEILQFVREWSKNTEKHANVLGDLYKVQDINDKLQEVIMEERTHCQHLVGINDQLETQRQIMSRKYQAALILGKVEEKSVHHLLEKNPKAVPLTDKLSELGDEIKRCKGKQQFGEVSDPLVLAGRVQTLEKYVEDLKKHHREEISVLKETISQSDLKCESIKAQYTDLVKRNAKSLQEMKEVLGASIRENLDLRQEVLRLDSDFFELQVNKAKMTDKARKTSYRPSASASELIRSYPEENAADERDREFQMRLAKSEIDLAKKSNLLRDTVSKVVMLERKCARLEEENQSLRKANERSLKAHSAKNAVLEKRCEKTESRLKLEQQGVRHELTQCKNLMKMLLRSINTFTREQANLKRTLSEFTKQVNLGVQAPEALDRVVSATAQANSDLRLHAMNLWAEYLGNKISNIEEVATTGRNKAQVNDDIRTLYVNPSVIKNAKEDMRVQGKSSTRMNNQDSVDNLIAVASSSIYSMPPNWLSDNQRLSNYASLLEHDDLAELEEDLSSPPDLG